MKSTNDSEIKIMKKQLFTLLLCLLAKSAFSQFVNMDIVKVKNKNFDEAIYYFEQNWKAYREVAIKQGIISSYRMYLNRTDSLQHHIILVTEYPDSTTFKNSRENFRPILKSVRPNGPILLNQKQPDEFREFIHKDYRVIAKD